MNLKQKKPTKYTIKQYIQIKEKRWGSNYLTIIIIFFLNSFTLFYFYIPYNFCYNKNSKRKYP